MAATVSLTQTQIFVALVAVLSGFGLTAAQPGDTVSIIRGQVNRVPEPSGQDFIVMWPIARDRLAMNQDVARDTIITGSIAANVLTVTAVTLGPVAAGQTLYSKTAPLGCVVQRQINGTTGGAGTYAVSPVADYAAGTIYAGTIAATQETEITIQADVHGPNSADNAQRLSTLFRDDYGYTAFGAQGVALTPLYTSEPRQIPFENGEQQTEERWVVDLCMQADIAIVTAIQFADTLAVTVLPVTAIPIP